MNKFIISFFGIGLIPKAGELLAILIGLIIGVTIIKTSGLATLGFMIVFLTLFGIFATEKYIKMTNEHDPKIVVIDEIVGIWFTLFGGHILIPILNEPLVGSNFSETSAFLIFTFLSYFILNLYKPSLIGMVRNEGDGGLSVMGDDLMSGFFASLMTAFFMLFFYAFEFWLKL